MRRYGIFSLLLISMLTLVSCSGDISSSNVTEQTAPHSVETMTSFASSPDTVQTVSSVSETAVSGTTLSGASESGYFPVNKPSEQALFDPEYYAVLRGEGAYFLVYDCYGNVVCMFPNSNPYDFPPLGLVDAHYLEGYVHIPQDGETTDTGKNRRYFTGGYLETSGEHLFTDSCLFLSDGSQIPIDGYNYYEYHVFAKTGITEIVFWGSIPNADLSSFCLAKWYQISEDGTVLKQESIQTSYSDIQLVGDNYYIAKGKETGGEYTLYDQSGKPVMQDVSPMYFGNTIHLSEFGCILSKYDYFLSGNQVYDENLTPVAADTVTKDGDLIPGVTYFVDGISCKVISPLSFEGRRKEFLPPSFIAVGYNGQTAAIKTSWGTCVISGTEAEVMNANPGYVIFDNGDVYSFKNGEFVMNVKERYIMTQDYVLFYGDDAEILSDVSDNQVSLDSRPLHTHFFLLDNDGSIRYGSDVNRADVCSGNCFLLSRGPYVGIADLDGNWIIKAIENTLARDAGNYTPYG